MALELICPFCGHPNGLGKVFCASCGQNMQQGDKPPRIVGKGQKTGFRKFLSVAFKLLTLTAMALFTGLIFWPTKPDIQRSTGQAFQTDLTAFHQAYRKLETDLTAFRGGQAERAVFTAPEKLVNAYLKDTLDKNNSRVKTTGAFTPKVTDVSVNFEKGRARLFLSYAIGPVVLTYETVVDSGDYSNGIAPHVASARVGHLPLPGLAHTLSTSKFRALQKGLHSLDYVVQNATAWQFKEDAGAAAFLRTKPQPSQGTP